MLTISSIAKKQIVALSGLLLVIFIIFHLAGNMFIYGGPEAFNGYAKKLHSLGGLMWVARFGLLAVFLTHFLFTFMVVTDNIRARGGLQRYAVDKPVGKRSWFTRLMPFSGTYILVFVIWHILDFTAINQEGPRSVINGVSYGIYGVVVNALSDPLHAIFYIIAMCFLGMHLAHGVQSYFQTTGYRHPVFTPFIQRVSNIISFIVAIGFSSIPLYVLYLSH